MIWRYGECNFRIQKPFPRKKSFIRMENFRLQYRQKRQLRGKERMKERSYETFADYKTIFRLKYGQKAREWEGRQAGTREGKLCISQTRCPQEPSGYIESYNGHAVSEQSMPRVKETCHHHPPSHYVCGMRYPRSW